MAAILEQEGKAAAYASRALTITESRYSQTEPEALGQGRQSKLLSGREGGGLGLKKKSAEVTLL